MNIVLQCTIPCMIESKIQSPVWQAGIDSSNSINIIILSDLGNNTNRNDKSAIDTITALAETADSISFYLREDDISYTYGPMQLPIEFYEATWNTFQEDMEVVTADNIQSDLPGNHEVTCNPSEKLDYEND